MAGGTRDLKTVENGVVVGIRRVIQNLSLSDAVPTQTSNCNNRQNGKFLNQDESLPEKRCEIVLLRSFGRIERSRHFDLKCSQQKL